jgi:hypothetical protein
MVQVKLLKSLILELEKASKLFPDTAKSLDLERELELLKFEAFIAEQKLNSDTTLQ